jgi:hypothetical protein
VWVPPAGRRMSTSRSALRSSGAMRYDRVGRAEVY